MAEFIKEHYKHGAGIVYTYSRKDADTVANTLCDYGVIAEVSNYLARLFR
jgi:ATP-dependent DNA helicase Q1